jgi:hypothetical protein
MMILQRLHAKGTLTTAVQLLQQGAAQGLLEPCKRVREGRIGCSPGGYCQGRLALPAEEIVELYGRRVNIETDLRSLKRTVRLRRQNGWPAGKGTLSRPFSGFLCIVEVTRWLGVGSGF